MIDNLNTRDGSGDARGVIRQLFDQIKLEFTW